ncbi:hypothetical protein K6C39_22670, partial [Vibrio vulnificus]|nr:hypothetical protein [Vibrio vulnificus]
GCRTLDERHLSDGRGRAGCTIQQVYLSTGLISPKTVNWMRRDEIESASRGTMCAETLANGGDAHAHSL